MGIETVFVLLFALASAVALLARWLKVPYTVALVLAGLVLAASHTLEPPHLTKELTTAERQMVLAEKQRVLEAGHHGVIGHEALDALLIDIDERLHQIDKVEGGH